MVTVTNAISSMCKTSAVADTASASEDNTIDINVLVNDLVQPGLVKSLYSVSQNGTKVAITATTKLGATVTINPNGTVKYDPTHAAAIQSLAQDATATDTFTYTMKEATRSGTNSTLSTATVTIKLTGANDPPVITGAVSGQKTTDTAGIQPFSHVVIADVDSGAQDSVTIKLIDANGNPTDANGTLAGVGLTKTMIGTYTLAATAPSALTGELAGLTFTPVAHEVATGQTVTTGFTLAVSDGRATATDVKTSVITSGSSISTIARTDANVDSVDVGPVLVAGTRSFNSAEVVETANGRGLDSFSGSTSTSKVDISDLNTGDSYHLSHLAESSVLLDGAYSGSNSGLPQSVTMDDVTQAQVVLDGGVAHATVTINQTDGGRNATVADYGQNNTTVINAGMNATTVGTLYGNDAKLTVNDPYTNPSVPTSIYLAADGQNDTLCFIGGTTTLFLIFRFDLGASGTALGNGVGGNRFLLFANSTTNLTGGAGEDTYNFFSADAGTTTVSGGWNSIIENFDAFNDVITLPIAVQGSAIFTSGVSDVVHGSQPETTISIAATTASAASLITVIGADLTSVSSAVHWR